MDIQKKAILKITLFLSLFSAVVIILPTMLTSVDSDYMSRNANDICPTEYTHTLVDTRRTQPEEWQPPQLTREQFLEDFDYLINALEENFPSFGIIYRRNGVDMLELASELRGRILDESIEWDYLPFWNMLRSDFFRYAYPVGHLWLTPYYPNFHAWYSHPAIARGVGRTSVYRYFGRRLTHHIASNAAISQNTYNREVLGFSDSFTVTQILEENHIAYIRIPQIRSASGSTPHFRDMQRVDDFYSQLEGFGHLIIDLRGITGGWPDIFNRLLISPLIDHPIETTFHYFYMAGEYNMRHIRNLPRSSFRERGSFEVYDLNNIFAPNTLTEYIIADLRYMDYYLERLLTVTPNPERRAPFNGKVWLLTDSLNFSGAQQLAAFFHQTGFATLVGQTTGGMAADGTISSSYFILPNTTFRVRYDPIYIVSADGRPWEYGTVPHHFNREGMNALQTVLALIAEGNY